MNASHAASADPAPEKWRVTQVMLKREIENAPAAAAEHPGEEDEGEAAIGCGA